MPYLTKSSYTTDTLFISIVIKKPIVTDRWNDAQGWRQEFSDGGADSFDEGAKIWFSEYYKCQKYPKNSFSPSDAGLACSDGGL